MRRSFRVGAVALVLVTALVGAGAAQAAAPGVHVTVLTRFGPDDHPAADAATNPWNVVAIDGTKIVRVAPNGEQTLLTTTPSGVFGGPIGIAYGAFDELYVALPSQWHRRPKGRS